MPMIMEDQSFEEKFDDMDDLFLDPQPPLNPPPSLTKEVLQRVDEYSVNGCCQKLAWSKNGVIARISWGGQAVNLQTFIQDQAIKEFILSQPTPLELPSFHDGQELVHICWSKTGHEIAIVDSRGGLSIFQSIYGLLNRMVAVGRHIPEQSDASTAIVGLEWLNTNTNRPVQFQYHAKLQGNQWTFPSNTVTFRGPTHPVPGKTAVTFITRRGTLHLLFAILQMTPENPCDEVTTVLEDMEDQPNFLTHASIATESGPTLLVATCDSCLNVCVYRVAVDWNFPYSGKDLPPRGYRIQPTLDVTRLKSFNLLTADMQTSNLQLLHFSVLPTALPGNLDFPAPDTILAIFTGNENSMEANSVSRVIRYQLQQEMEQLHSSFDQLATRKKKLAAMISLHNIYSVSRLLNIDIPGVIINYTNLRDNTILALTKSDGVVIFLDRFTMQQIQRNPGLNEIHTLMDAGFSFPLGAQSCHFALSPNCCAAAAITEDDSITVRYMEYLVDENNESMLQTRDDICPAAIALLFATSQAQQQSHDDIMVLIEKNKTTINIKDLFENMFIAVNIYFDYTSDAAQKLLNSSSVPRCLALQYALGISETQQSIPSKFAWILINLRQTAWAMHIGLGVQKDEITQCDLPGSLLGVLEWYIDLMCSIVNDLFWISRGLEDSEDSNQFLQNLINNPHSATLPLLLTTIARAFFRWRFLRNLDAAAKQRAAIARPHETHSWRTFIDVVANSPVSFARFDMFLAEVDHYVKKAYDDAGWTTEVRGAAERTMVVSGRVPEVLLPVVQRLLTSALEKVLGDVGEPGRLAENRGMNLTRATTGDVRGAKWDVSRKVPMFGVREVKKCTMCGSVAENLVPRPGRFPPWILSLQKSCVCGNAWVVVDV